MESMQIRKISISNFRGIRTLEWLPDAALCFIIGPGDSGKSTILDAIEAALSSRWFSFVESDFFGADTATPIMIEVTVGELPPQLMSDDRLGLFIRGWTGTEIHDEPEDDDEPVITVRLSVDATMEPVWEAYCDRSETSRYLSNRERSHFGLTRLNGDEARHTSWAQGSGLAKLTDDNGNAAERLAAAYKAAKNSAGLDKILPLMDAAGYAEDEAKALGAYVESGYRPGLELARGGFSTSSITLHDADVPLRLAGLGSRRLATLGIQNAAIHSGAIILVDEIEHGLEPHRIIGALAQLKKRQSEALKERRPVGQLFLTTHSDVALSEASASNVVAVRRDKTTKAATVHEPGSSAEFEKLMKKTPRALFARRILLCEGVTEQGLLLGLRELWLADHDGAPVEQMGSAIADGNGSEAPNLAIALRSMGYAVAIFRDSDRPIPELMKASFAFGGALIEVFEYETEMDTEFALFFDADDDAVQELIELARSKKSADSVAASLAKIMPTVSKDIFESPFSNWDLLTEFDARSLRIYLAKAASKHSWFKELSTGRELAPIAWRIAQGAPHSELARCLKKVEAWLYA